MPPHVKPRLLSSTGQLSLFFHASSVMPALLIGLIAEVVCFLMVDKMKVHFGYDDSLDAFGVHGAGGTAGVILAGEFATKLVNPIFKNDQGVALLPGA